MNKYKLTVIGLVLAVLIYLISIFLELNLIEQCKTLLASIQQFELNEIVIPVLIFFVFLYLDTHRRSKRIQVENAKRNIYKAMLSSSHHILNNFIYQMGIFKITAEDTPGFDSKILDVYDDIVNSTSHKINSLSNLTTIDEFSIRKSVMNE